MTVAPEIHEAFTKLANTGPLLYVWLFDPVEGEVELHDLEGNLIDKPTHFDLAKKYPHPDRIHGYAHRIIRGWRVTDWEHKPVEDKFVLKQVHKALKDHASKAE